MNARTRDMIHDCAIDTLREMSEILQALDLELDDARHDSGRIHPHRIAVLGEELRANHQFLLALTTRTESDYSSLSGTN